MFLSIGIGDALVVGASMVHTFDQKVVTFANY
jgi:hypothetical protein